MLRGSMAAALVALSGCATSPTPPPQSASDAAECREEKPTGSQLPVTRCRDKQNAQRHRDAVQLELLRPRPFNLRGG